MSIYKRKSGKYAVLIDLDPGQDGLRRRRSLGTYETKKEAEKAERDALASRDRGIDLAPGKVTVADMMTRYLDDCDTRCGLKTMERYRELNRTYVVPNLASIALAKLRPAHISEWCSTLLKQGGAKGRSLSPKTVRHAYALLKGALSWAVRMQLAATNPAVAVKPPHAPRGQVTALSLEEATCLLDAARGTRWEGLITFALTTGARRGEIAALRWESVDFETGTAMIRASLTETRAGVSVKGTKTDRARLVPLSPLCVDALRRQRVRQAEQRLSIGALYEDRGYVFSDPLGANLKPFAITDAFRELAGKAKITITKFHALRHTAATWMLAGGADVRSTSGILGHSTPSTTLSVYAHAVASAQVSAVSKIDERLASLKKEKAV